MCLMSNSPTDTAGTRLRQWVAKREGVADVLEPIWDLIVDDRLVGEWRTSDPELRDKVREEILARYRRYKRLVRETGGSAVSTTLDRQQQDSTLFHAELPTGDPVALRAEALCLYWGKLAEAEDGVRKYRRDVLGGATLSESAAQDLIRSPAAAVAPLAFFIRCKQIPIVGHTAEFLSYEKANPFERPYWARAALRIRWPGGEFVANPNVREPAPLETLPFWDG